MVSSPTFTISNIYDCRDGIQVHHFDFYRLSEGGMVAHELAEVLGNSKAVIIIEWGEVVEGILPKQHLAVWLERVSAGEDYRKITMSYSTDLAYLVKGLSS